MEKLLNVSSSPHVRDKSSTKSIMRDVCIALIPATLVGIGNFGVRALLVILTTCVSTVLAEYVWQRLMKQKVTTYDFSALLTGLLLALNLPATLPLWMCVIGGVFAIIIVKQLFGGLGQNFMNPALGARCFLMVSFAAVTSSVSVMEAIVSSMMDKFHVSRKKGTILTTLYGMIVGVIVCLGYNKLYFELKLPNGTVAQILDVMDYISNNCLMPMVALLTCILIGWVVKPKVIIDEVTLGGYRFGREKLYVAMIKVIAPLMLLILLVQSVGL